MKFKEALKNLLKDYGIIKPKEEMVSYEVVYEPDVRDAHNEWASKETLEKACENFNKNLQEGVVKSNLCHAIETDGFSIVDTWIHKEFDVTVDGTGEAIKAGTWIAKLQFNDPDLWEAKKAGIFGGVSIGGRGYINKETGEITDITFDVPTKDTQENEEE